MALLVGRAPVINERHRTYVFMDLGVDWADAGYGLYLQIVTPSSTTSYVACTTVSGEPYQAQLPIDSVVYSESGTYRLRLVATLGTPPATVSNWALASESWPVNVLP